MNRANISKPDTLQFFLSQSRLIENPLLKLIYSCTEILANMSILANHVSGVAANVQRPLTQLSVPTLT